MHLVHTSRLALEFVYCTLHAIMRFVEIALHIVVLLAKLTKTNTKVQVGCHLHTSHFFGGFAPDSKKSVEQVEKLFL